MDNFSIIIMKTKICKRCGINKDIIEFRHRKSRGYEYIVGYCLKCENEQQRIRNSTPERKAYIKDKHQSEKYKLKRLEYLKTDNYKERVFNYNRTDKVKEKNKSFRKTENRVVYLQEYSKRDYVKERIKKHYNSDEYKINRKVYLETESGKIARKKTQETWLNSDKRILELLNKQCGIDKNLIPRELIELKRITLKTKRLCQQLKN